MLRSALAVLAAVVLLVRADIQEENHVLVVKKDTFEEALKNDYLLVEFCECGEGGWGTGRRGGF